MRKALLYVACLSALLCRFAVAQSQVDGSKPTLADHQVEHFQIADGTFLDGVAKLTRTVPANFGIEEILKAKYADPQIDNPRFSLDLRHATIASILNAMSQHDYRYTWAVDGSTINVYPRATVGDAGYLMNRSLKRATLNDVPNPDKALFALDRLLPPPREQFGYVQSGGDNSYDKPWTASFGDLTVREFVNRITEHLGPSTAWVLQGSQQERLFSFLRGVLNDDAADK
jgi:hypothetical protein